MIDADFITRLAGGESLIGYWDYDLRFKNDGKGLAEFRKEASNWVNQTNTELNTIGLGDKVQMLPPREVIAGPNVGSVVISWLITDIGNLLGEGFQKRQDFANVVKNAEDFLNQFFDFSQRVDSRILALVGTDYDAEPADRIATLIKARLKK
jgi:hypothetical protein